MKCYMCGKEHPTINYLGRNICGKCLHLLHITEDKAKVIYTSGRYTFVKPIWNSKLPYNLTKWIGIAIIILMLIERTVN